MYLYLDIHIYMGPIRSTIGKSSFVPFFQYSMGTRVTQHQYKSGTLADLNRGSVGRNSSETFELTSPNSGSYMVHRQIQNGRNS